MIRLGTVAAIGFEDFEPAEWLECYRQLGCEVVQAYRNHQARISIEQMCDVIAAAGLPCDSLHGVFGEEFDPSNPDEAGRRFAVDTYKSEADVCNAVGGKLVVVHCSTIRAQGVDDDEKRGRFDQLRKSIAELGAHGAANGITYAFENLPGYHAIGYDVGELAAVIKDVAAPHTGMCFDTGHANMTGDPVAAVAAAAGTMIYCHVSDNSGEADEHEMITYGGIDADGKSRALHAVGYEGTYMLEVFYPVEKLRQIIDQGAADRLAHIIRLANGQEE